MFFFNDSQEQEFTERYKAFLEYLRDSNKRHMFTTIVRKSDLECIERNGKFYVNLPGVSTENFRINVENIKDFTFVTILGISEMDEIYKEVIIFKYAKDKKLCSSFENGLLIIEFK